MPVSKRTRVDLVTEGDAEQIHRYYLRNEEHLCPWEPTREKGHHSLDTWRARATYQEQCIKSGASYHFAIRLNDHDDVVGLCNFNNVARGAFLACYLGYSIDQKQQGKGLMFEALSAAIPFVFSEFKLHRIMANYMPTNEKSGRLLQRLGFEREGYAKDYLKISGVWEDHILTSRIRHNHQ